MALAAAIGADRVGAVHRILCFGLCDRRLRGGTRSVCSVCSHCTCRRPRRKRGHDLNLLNLPQFTIPHLLEVSIGHALTVDALRFGFAESVKRYIEALAARASK